MRYRNDTGAPLTLATDPPVTVLPGWTVDADTHITGLTPIGEDGEPAAGGELDGVQQVGPDAPTPGTPGAEPPADTSAPALPLADIHLEPPADWPVEQGTDTPSPAQHQVAAGAGVRVQPNQAAPAGDGAEQTTGGADAPADTTK